MSKTIREYSSIQEIGDGSDSMTVTAFVGGERFGFSVQLTIGGKFCCLSELQVQDLILVLTGRLQSLPGFTATEWGEGLRIEPERI